MAARLHSYDRDFLTFSEVLGSPALLRELTQVNYTSGTVVLKVDNDFTYERVEVQQQLGWWRFRKLMRRIERATGTKWHRWYSQGEYRMYGWVEEDSTRSKEERLKLVA